MLHRLDAKPASEASEKDEFARKHLLSCLGNYYIGRVSESPAELKVCKDTLLGNWAEYLDSHYSHQTAIVYRSAVSRYLERLPGLNGNSVDSLNLAFQDNPVTRTGYFLDEFHASKGKMETVVRSIILGKFLPWAKHNGFLEVDLNQFERLVPVSFRLMKFPFVEQWLTQEFGLLTNKNKGAIAQARAHLKAYATFIATKKLNINLGKYEVDARELMRSEYDGSMRIARSLLVGNFKAGPLLQRPYEPPYLSITEVMHFDKACAADFALFLSTDSDKSRQAKHTLSGIRGYFKFAHENGFSFVSPKDFPASRASRSVPRAAKRKDVGTPFTSATTNSILTTSTQLAGSSSSKSKKNEPLKLKKGGMRKNIFQHFVEQGTLNGFTPTIDDNFLPTDAMPGSSRKIEVLAERVNKGYPLWHENDR